MTDQQTTEPKITCPICGHNLTPAAIVGAEQTEQPLCSEGLAEEGSCGCADD